MKLLLSKKETAELLGCGLTKVDELRSLGELQEVRLSDGPKGRVRITLASVEDFIARRVAAAEGVA